MSVTPRNRLIAAVAGTAGIAALLAAIAEAGLKS